MLTEFELEQARTYIFRHLPRVLEQDPDFVTMVEGIVAEKFPRRDEFARLLDEMTAARQEQRDGFHHVNYRLDKHEADIAELKDSVGELRYEVAGLRTGQDELRTGQDELRTGQDELRTGQDELRTGQDELHTGQDELRTGQDELRREVTDLRTGQDELRAGQDELRAGQDELRREVTDLRTGQDELRREVTDLRTGQDELQREVTDLRTGQDELRREVTDLRTGQDELRSGQEGLRHEVADLRTLIDERTEMLRKEFNNAVATLGQRWGMMSEDILRQVVAAVIEKSYGGTVRQVQIEDEEYDVVITNGSHILVEITARARQDVLRRLERKRKTYTEHTGVEPSRVILATAQIHISVARKLEQMGIEVIQPDVLIEGDTI